MLTHKKLNLIGIILSIIGISLSTILIQEYYGSTGKIAETVCSAFGSGDSCKQVAESKYSAFEIPVIGIIPVALLGFTYYGFMAYLFFLNYKEKEETNSELFLSFLFFASLFGIFMDLILFSISVFLIKTICVFCALTYLISILNFIIIYLQVRAMKEKNHFANITKTLKTNSLNYLIIFLVFFSCGKGIGNFYNSDTKNNQIPLDSAGENSFLKQKIEEYNKRPDVKINLTEAPFSGNKSAPVVIVKYADFNCGHCMHTSQILKQVKAEFPNDVVIYYKNFPLDGNCNYLVERKSPTASSCVAATAALCANKQNKFNEMYHLLYDDLEKGTNHSAMSVLLLAEKLSLKLDQFKTCMSSNDVKDFINREVKEGDVLKIQSTPSLFVNNKPLDPGTPNANFLMALIREKLGKK
jgi:protein-disulfide isomerase